MSRMARTWYRLPAIMRFAGFRSRCTMGDGFLLCIYASPRDASSASSTARRSDTAYNVTWQWRQRACPFWKWSTAESKLDDSHRAATATKIWAGHAAALIDAVQQ